MAADWQNMGRSHIARRGDFRVTTRTLDTFHLDDVSLIKIDVEGYEGKVLMGARLTVERSHPAIVVEDEYDAFGDHLMWAGLTGYRKTREWPGANDLWEWS